jgi:hypothetical protein
MSSVDATPEQFPVVHGQLSAIIAEALQSVTASAPWAIPGPMGGDVVSLMLPIKATEQAGKFYPCALQGIGCGADGTAVIPKIGADHALADALGEITVATHSIFG